MVKDILKKVKTDLVQFSAKLVASNGDFETFCNAKNKKKINKKDTVL